MAIPSGTLRSAGGAVALLSVALLVVVIVIMAQRLRDDPAFGSNVRWAVGTVEPDEFTYFGGVQGRVLDTADGVRIEWGEDAIDLPITGRLTAELPGLAKYRGWFALLALVPVTDGADIATVQQRLEAGEQEPMLVATLRAPAPGADPETWGAGDYKDWRYTYYVLGEDGAIKRNDEPYTYTHWGKEITETGYRSYRSVNLEPDSWKFVAAMHITPGLHTPAARNSSPFSYPNYVGVRHALRAMGWTWPVAGVSVLTAIVGGLVFAGSFVRRPAT